MSTEVSPRLPDAEPQNPSCGACYGDTDFDGDDFVCEDCQLAFSPRDFHAFFLDPDAEKCGKTCENPWHGPDKIKPGIEFNCGPCQLPTGHKSDCWNGCLARKVEK